MPPKKRAAAAQKEKTHKKKHKSGKEEADDRGRLGDDSEPEDEGEGEEKPVSVSRDDLPFDKKYKVKAPKWVGEWEDLEDEISASAYTDEDQDREWNYHMTSKAGGAKGAPKLVPPMHPEWPWEEFKKGMKFEAFLHTLATNKTCLEIMKWEIDFEVVQRFELERVKEAESPHFQKQMQWAGWSAMLQLEVTYPDIMEKCQGFPTCFLVMWKEFVNNTTWSKAQYDKLILQTLEDINTIVHAVWENSGVAQPSAVRTFVTTRVLNPLRDGKAFERRFASKERAGARAALVNTGPLQLPDAVQDKLRRSGENRLSRHLRAPKTIPESMITIGVRKLVRDVWRVEEESEAPDTRNEVEFADEKGLTGLTDQIKAACCLLELMCGSRLLGILLVNWFEKLEGATLQEWEVDKAKEYGAYARCVRVTRLSKEGTTEAREEKQKNKAGSTDLDVVDRVIVKPINFHFIDPKWLWPSVPGTQPLTDKGRTSVDIFLHLIKGVREYLFKPERINPRGLKSMTRGGMPGLTDAQAQKIPESARSWMAAMDHSINKYAKNVFVEGTNRMFKPNEGTHLFRKIYVNWAYNAFAKKTMKEVGFASEVLGHRGFKVSLNYTSLIITPSFSGELKSSKDITEQFNLIQKHLSAIDADLETMRDKYERGRNEVQIDGQWLEKAEKPKYGATVEEHTANTEKQIERLKSLGIKATWVNLRLIGAVTSTAVQRALKAKKDMKENLT